MGKKYLVAISKELHQSLEDAAQKTGLSMAQLADGILRGKLTPGLPLGNRDPDAEFYEKIGKAYVADQVNRITQGLTKTKEALAELAENYKDMFGYAAKLKELTELIKAHPETAKKLFGWK